jgi:hypothetical protein
MMIVSQALVAQADQARQVTEADVNGYIEALGDTIGVVPWRRRPDRQSRL